MRTLAKRLGEQAGALYWHLPASSNWVLVRRAAGRRGRAAGHWRLATGDWRARVLAQVIALITHRDGAGTFAAEPLALGNRWSSGCARLRFGHELILDGIEAKTKG